MGRFPRSLRELLEGERVAVKSVGESARERVKGALLLTLVVLVQIAWGAALVYLAVHFL